MCKVLMIAGIKRQHQEKVKKLCVEMIKYTAVTDNDGFGYAAITSKGHIYGEKWLKKEDAFVTHAQPKPDPAQDVVKAVLGEAARFVNSSNDEKVYDSFGARIKENINDTVSIIVHARNQTVGFKSIANTHPFVELNNKDFPQTALIHNGTIRNHESLTKKYSTCDSEVLLHEYLKNMIYYNPYGIDQLAKDVVGEYTTGVLSSIHYDDGTCIPILDIFKSHKDLFVGYVRELETLVFATTQFVLEHVVNNAGMTVTGIAEVRDGDLLRLNAITGERMEDLIPFVLSQRYEEFGRTGTTTDHHRIRHPINAPRTVGPYTHSQHTRHETSENVKANFEKNHPELFTSTYYQPGQRLNEREKEFFAELEKNGDTNMRALRLVKKIMNL
jgi:Glutamine amidotransferase domain